MEPTGLWVRAWSAWSPDQLVAELSCTPAAVEGKDVIATPCECIAR